MGRSGWEGIRQGGPPRAVAFIEREQPLPKAAQEGAARMSASSSPGPAPHQKPQESLRRPLRSPQMYPYQLASWA